MTNIENYRFSKSTLALWGKKDVIKFGGKNREKKKRLWLPLVAHLIDTKNTILWLYDNWISEANKEYLSSSLGESETKNLLAFLGVAHDIGKASPAFETEECSRHDKEIDTFLLNKLEKNGFTKISQFDPILSNKSKHAKLGEALLESEHLDESIGAIVGSHHGMTPQSSPTKKQLNDYSFNVWQIDKAVLESSKTDPKTKLKLKEIQQRWKDVQQELINFALKNGHYDSLSDVPSVDRNQAVIIEGLLIMADWLASCTHITKEKKDSDSEKEYLPMFNLIPLDKGFKDLDMDKRFKRAIKNWQIGNDSWKPKEISNSKLINFYKERFDIVPYPTQLKMSKIIGKLKDPGLIIVEAGMGSGKTEVSLTGAEQLAARTKRNGVYFALPTQATSNAMFDRFKKWLTVLTSDEQLKVPVELMHGNAKLNSTRENLPQATSASGSSAVDLNEWFSKKKAVLVPFGVGTIDQLLLMGLKQKHLFFRHLGFSNKVVIIDEIHAYDSFIYSYLEKALEWLGADHVPVIALSATLPAEKRQGLMDAYLKGKYGPYAKPKTDRDWINTVAYPLLTYLDGKKVVQVDNFDQSTIQQKDINITIINKDDKELADEILSKIKNGGIAGVIVNTVKRSQKMAHLLEDKVGVLVLHSSFLSTDKMKIEDKLEKMIGKNGKRPKKLVVVGTQVLEQSLDIDFDVLFTDIAPVDLLLQRIGRLHRHEIPRPLNLSQPHVYIMGIKNKHEFDKSNEFIYQKYILTKTAYFLPKVIHLPQDIPVLVRKVYDASTDQEIENTLTKDEVKEYEKQKMKYAETNNNEQEAAQTYQIDNPYDSDFHRYLFGWLNEGDEDIDKNEIKAEASVRDIQPTVEVTALICTKKGNKLLNGKCLDTVDDKEIAEQTIRLPFGIMNYMGNNSIDIINTTSENTKKLFPNWKNNSWLRKALVLPFTDDKTAKLNIYYDSERKKIKCIFDLEYSAKFGLSFSREREE